VNELRQAALKAYLDGITIGDLATFLDGAGWVYTVVCVDGVPLWLTFTHERAIDVDGEPLELVLPAKNVTDMGHLSLAIQTHCAVFDVDIDEVVARLRGTVGVQEALSILVDRGLLRKDERDRAFIRLGQTDHYPYGNDDGEYARALRSLYEAGTLHLGRGAPTVQT
jgi:hypothetical protein